MDEGKIEKIVMKLGLLEFYHNIKRLLSVWFEGVQTDAIASCISDYIFSNGAYGTYENKYYADELRATAKQGKISATKSKTFWRMLFMPLQEMQTSYKILHKYPFLLPFFWVVRWFDVLIHRRKNIGKKFQIIRDMNDEKVTQHQKMMEFMGLRYDYQTEEDA
jgi:hypothetical protein